MRQQHQRLKRASWLGAILTAALWIAPAAASGEVPPGACGPEGVCGSNACLPVELPKPFCTVRCEWRTTYREEHSCIPATRVVEIPICRPVPCNGPCGPSVRCEKDIQRVTVPDCRPIVNRIPTTYCEKITECHEFLTQCDLPPGTHALPPGASFPPRGVGAPPPPPPPFDTGSIRPRPPGPPVLPPTPPPGYAPPPALVIDLDRKAPAGGVTVKPSLAPVERWLR